MSKSILILDDDLTFAETLARSFKRKGYDSFVALDISHARANLIEHKPDFAVVDLKIDQESGLHFLPILSELSPKTKALVLTGYSSISTTVEAMKLGCVNYLCKPVNTDEIIQAFYDDQAHPDASIPETPPSVNRLEWEHIQRVLSKHDGNISATAKALGMHRRTLQRKLQKRPVLK
jgi:two-component system response regulator RegA